ncbi:MAG: hemin uptake protein HemP [Bacteroidales bacterium]|nr:hemin uptake protein HemP [Bacteroidales bacterium]
MTEYEPEKRETRPTEAERVIRAEDLFQEKQELWIEHNGERYRLRITRRGKLILQK